MSLIRGSPVLHCLSSTVTFLSSHSLHTKCVSLGTEEAPAWQHLLTSPTEFNYYTILVYVWDQMRGSMLKCRSDLVSLLLPVARCCRHDLKHTPEALWVIVVPVLPGVMTRQPNLWSVMANIIRYANTLFNSQLGLCAQSDWDYALTGRGHHKQ